MAKDPAMLWYWGDWFSGTSLMSRFLKGCYMDLLHAQFNSGRLSLEEIKICLGSDFGQAWPALQKKFTKSPDGLFFNERLEQEKEKRKAFCDSRGKNRTAKVSYDPSHENHMGRHMENENKNEIRNDSSVFPKKPAKKNLNDPLSEMEAGKAIEYAGITLQRKYDPERIADLWTAFCIQEEETYHPSRNEKVRHFRNWLKTQPYDTDKKFNGGGNKGNSGGKLGTSEARTDRARNW